MKLSEKLEQAAFWHEGFCLECVAAVEEPGAECECGSTCIVDARVVLGFFSRLLAEQDQEDEK